MAKEAQPDSGAHPAPEPDASARPSPATASAKTNSGQRKYSRRAFLAGAAAGGAAVWAGTALPRRLFSSDPHRAPKLYEFYLDNFWFDTVDLYRQPRNPPLKGMHRADLAIVGGGFAGLASAFHLARRLPGKRIVLLEGALCGYGASGRNGGFADTGFWGIESIYATQGPEAARAFFDATVAGRRQIETLVRDFGIDCDFELSGSLRLATDPEHLQAFEARQRMYDAMGLACDVLDGTALRQAIHSDRFHGAFRDPSRGILNPAKLVRGMKRVVEGLGVEVFEGTKVMRLDGGADIRLVTEFGEVIAPNVVVTVNGYAPQIGIFPSGIIPLCNYVVATEPLSGVQRAAIGWAGREGLSDERVQFMYFRLTADDRIVFGGEMSPYFYDNDPSSGNYGPAVTKLQRSILQTFPQLEGVRFTHSWGGTMGFTADFSPVVGRLGEHGNLFYALGFCGEGVVMTQLAAMIVADLVTGESSSVTGLPFVNKRPPYAGGEPVRYPAIKLYERWLTLTAGL